MLWICGSSASGITTPGQLPHWFDSAGIGVIACGFPCHRMTDYMVEGLSRKRAEIAGEIKRVHVQFGKLVADLGRVDATLGIVPPDLVLEA